MRAVLKVHAQRELRGLRLDVPASLPPEFRGEPLGGSGEPPYSDPDRVPEPYSEVESRSM